MVLRRRHDAVLAEVADDVDRGEATGNPVAVLRQAGGVGRPASSQSAPQFRLKGARMQDIEFDEGGEALVVRTTDAAHIIDVADGVVLGGAIPTGRPDLTRGLAVAPDGLNLAVATTAGKAIWSRSLDALEWERAACRFAGRNLTRAEWQRYIGTLADYHLTCDE